MRLYRAMVTILVLLLLMAPVTVAQAAEVAEPAMSVQMWPEGEEGQMVVIVSAQLPVGQEAPAIVDLPLLEGATVLWVGEVLGNDPTKDIPVAQKIVEGKGGKSLRVELTTGTAAQYEASIPGLKVDGASVSSTVKWVQSAASPQTSFAVRLPANAGEVKIRPAAPADPQRNSAGETLYTLPDRALKAGDSVSIDISYTRGTGQQPLKAAPTLRDRLPLILGAIVVVLGALAVWLHLQSRARAEG